MRIRNILAATIVSMTMTLSSAAWAASATTIPSTSDEARIAIGHMQAQLQAEQPRTKLVLGSAPAPGTNDYIRWQVRQMRAASVPVTRSNTAQYVQVVSSSDEARIAAGQRNYRSR